MKIISIIRTLGRKILNGLPQRIKNSYYLYRTTQIPLQASFRYPDASSIITLLPIRPKIVVDIGANHGDWTNAYLQLLGNTAKFYLFEPIPSLYQKLKMRFENYSNVFIYDFAVSDNEGVADFYISNNDDLSSLEEIKSGVYPTFVKSTRTQVKTNTLNNIHETILHRANIDLLKIDTQGHEEKIVNASQETLKQTSTLLVEWSVIPIYQNGKDFLSLHNCLIDKGFRLSYIPYQHQWGYELSWADALYINTNYIAKK